MRANTVSPPRVYGEYKRTEGDWGSQEVIEEERYRAPSQRIREFRCKLVRTPNQHRVVSKAPLVMEGEDYHHRVYASCDTGYGRPCLFACSPAYPDTQDGLDLADTFFRKALLELHKMKNHPPKKWSLFIKHRCF